MFTGYTDQTVDVFWGIRFNNDRAWFAEHKQEFQDAVMAPTKALAAELYDWFQADYPDLHLNLHISRIYRDALVENALRSADYNAWYDATAGDGSYTTSAFGMKYTTK